MLKRSQACQTGEALSTESAAPRQAGNDPKGIYRDSWLWNAGLSALWFANNYKWFVLMLVIVPGQIAAMPDVPEGLKNTYWGWIFAAGAVWAFVGPALMGGWSDRLGRRRVFMITGSILTLIALFVMAGVERFWLLAAGYLMLQVSDDVIQGAYASLIPQIVPQDKQAKASAVLGALNLFAQIATVVAALFLSGLGGLKGHQWVYLGIGLVQIISLLCVLSAIKLLKEPLAKPEPSLSAEPKERHSGLKGWFSPLLNFDFRVVWISRVLINLGFFIVQPYLSRFLHDIVGRPSGDQLVFSLFGATISGEQTALMAVLLTLSFSGGVGALLSSRRMDRWGLKKTIMFAGVILAPVLAMIAFTKDYSLLWVLGIGFGFAQGTFISADWAMGAATVPDLESLGKDMGIWSSAVVFAQVTAGLSGGIIDGLNKMQMGVGYSAAFLFSGCVMLAGTQLIRLVKKVK